MFENMELRRMFEPKKEDITEYWIELFNKEVYKFVCFTIYYYNAIHGS
jgi:hypothetical protein